MHTSSSILTWLAFVQVTLTSTSDDAVRKHDLSAFITWIDSYEVDVYWELARFGQIQSIHLFRERGILHHEFALVSFANQERPPNWIRLERAARFKNHWHRIQADSLGPIIGGARLRETISFARSKDALLPMISPADEIASVILPTIQPRTPIASHTTFPHFMATVHAISQSKDQYRLFSDNCRWFARRIVLTVAELGLINSQRAVRCHGDLVSDVLFLRTLQSDRYGGRQLSGPGSTLVKARVLQRVAENITSATFSSDDRLHALSAIAKAQDLFDSMPADSWPRQHFSGFNLLLTGQLNRYSAMRIPQFQLACSVTYAHWRRTFSTFPNDEVKLNSAERLFNMAFQDLTKETEMVLPDGGNTVRAGDLAVYVQRWISSPPPATDVQGRERERDLIVALDAASKHPDSFIVLRSHEALLWLRLTLKQGPSQPRDMQELADRLYRFTYFARRSGLDETVLLATLEEARCYQIKSDKAHFQEHHYALALRRSAHMLSQTGRVDEACRAEDEASAAYNRALAKAPSLRYTRPFTLTPWPDSTGNGQANYSIPDHEDAVQHYRRLSGAFGTRFHSELSQALRNLAVLLHGNPTHNVSSGALEAITEAIVLHRTLPIPSSGSRSDELVDMLLLQASCAASLRETIVAVTASEEAVELYRIIVTENEDHDDAREKLADLLGEHAHFLYCLAGEVHRAIEYSAENLVLERTLFTQMTFGRSNGVALLEALARHSAYLAGITPDAIQTLENEFTQVYTECVEVIDRANAQSGGEGYLDLREEIYSSKFSRLAKRMFTGAETLYELHGQELFDSTVGARVLGLMRRALALRREHYVLKRDDKSVCTAFLEALHTVAGHLIRIGKAEESGELWVEEAMLMKEMEVSKVEELWVTDSV